MCCPERFAAAAGLSLAYRRSLCHDLSWLKRDFGPQPIADITTLQVDAWLRAANGNHTTKSNVRRVFVTLFKWARDCGYLPQDRETTPERAMNFSGPESAAASFRSGGGEVGATGAVFGACKDARNPRSNSGPTLLTVSLQRPMPAALPSGWAFPTGSSATTSIVCIPKAWNSLPDGAWNHAINFR